MEYMEDSKYKFCAAKTLFDIFVDEGLSSMMPSKGQLIYYRGGNQAIIFYGEGGSLFVIADRQFFLAPFSTRKNSGPPLGPEKKFRSPLLYPQKILTPFLEYPKKFCPPIINYTPLNCC